MDRRQFLKKILKVGGITAALAYGFPLEEIYAASGAFMGSCQTVASGVTHLLQEDGEGHADGTNMTAAGWTADGDDPGDLCEIDTAQHNTGSGSVLVDNDGAVADGYVYKDFTEQSSGTFYVDFYIRAAAVSGSNVSLLVSDADGYNMTNDCATAFHVNGNDFEVFSGTAFVDVTGYTVISAETWYGIRLIMNVTTHTFDVHVDPGTGFAECNTGVAFQNNISPSRLYLRVDNGGGTDLWFDDIDIWKN